MSRYTQWLHRAVTMVTVGLVGLASRCKKRLSSAASLLAIALIGVMVATKPAYAAPGDFGPTCDWVKPIKGPISGIVNPAIGLGMFIGGGLIIIAIVGIVIGLGMTRKGSEIGKGILIVSGGLLGLGVAIPFVDAINGPC